MGGRLISSVVAMACCIAAGAAEPDLEVIRADLVRVRKGLESARATLKITSDYWDGKETLDSLGGTFAWNADAGAVLLERRETQQSKDGSRHPVRGGWFRWNGLTYRYAMLDDSQQVPTAGQRRAAELPLPCPSFAVAYGKVAFDRLVIGARVVKFGPEQCQLKGDLNEGPFSMQLRRTAAGWRLEEVRIPVHDHGTTFTVVLAFQAWQPAGGIFAIPLRGSLQAIGQTVAKPISYSATDVGPGEPMSLKSILRVGSVIADTEGEGQWLEMAPDGSLVSVPIRMQSEVNPWGLLHVASVAIIVFGISGWIATCAYKRRINGS